jgi:hypothetical protein
MTSGKLLREGENRAEFMGLENKTLFGFKPQVWFTMEMEMPFTACPMVGDPTKGNIPNNMFQQNQMSKGRGYELWEKRCRGIYRLKFNSRDIGAEKYIGGSARKKMKQNGMLGIFEMVAKMGNDDVTKWYHCKKQVEIHHMISIEKWIDGVWADVTDTFDKEKALAA